jgi:hypothetical protein
MKFSSSKIPFTANNQIISTVWPETQGIPLNEIEEVYSSYMGCVLALPQAQAYNPLYVGLVISSSKSLESFTLKDANNNTLAVVAPGEIYLTRCAYSTGEWSVFKLATNASNITAKELQGNGLSSWLGNLTTVYSKIKTVPSAGLLQYAVNAQDQSALLLCTNTGLSTVYLPTNVCTGFYVSIYNVGVITKGDVQPTAGKVTVITQPDSTSLVNNLPSFSLTLGQSATFVFDGANWWTATTGTNLVPPSKFTAIDVSTYTTAIQLSPAQIDSDIIYFYSTSVNYSNIEVYAQPKSPKVWIFCNALNNASSTLSITQGTATNPTGNTFTIPQHASITLFTTGLQGEGLVESGSYSNNNTVTQLTVVDGANISNLNGYNGNALNVLSPVVFNENITLPQTDTNNNTVTAKLPNLATDSIASATGGTIGVSSSIVCADNVLLTVPGGILTTGTSALSTVTATSLAVKGAATPGVIATSLAGDVTIVGDVTITGNVTINGNLTIMGTATAQSFTPTPAVQR